jgi:hypothetical protein
MNDLFTHLPAATWLKWTGRVISTVVVLFLLFDGISKFMDIAPVQRAMLELGYPSDTGVKIGVIAVVSAVMYAFPPTAVLGAVLITGLCGGAIASHLRIGSPLLSHILFGLYIGVLSWAGLWLRSERVRELFSR